MKAHTMEKGQGHHAQTRVLFSDSCNKRLLATPQRVSAIIIENTAEGFEQAG
jgi:hypothetical protein